jgi:hypothetical protein
VARDLLRSRAILIGNGVYRPDSGITDIPIASACVSAMGELLTSELCGWPNDQIMPLVDVQTPQELVRSLRKAVSDVEDTLLVYYVGHGIRTVKGKLALTVGDSDADPQLVQFSGILYESIAEILRCGATTKLVILDCCKAELGNTANDVFQSVDIAEEYLVEGLYFIGASKRHESAKFALDGHLTYFTENFIEVVKSGIPGPSPELRMDQIFLELRRRLVSGGLPEPVESGSRGAHEYVFARNAAYRPAGDDALGDRISLRPDSRPVMGSDERVAKSMTNKDKRIRALVELAKALVDSDPQEAKRLFADAECAARSNGWTRGSGLSYVAKAVADSDPREAERIANSFIEIPYVGQNWKASFRIGTNWKASTLAYIAQKLFDSDSRGAERIAKSITDSYLRTSVLVDLARTVTVSDPQRGKLLFAEAEQAARSCKWPRPPREKARALADVSKAMARRYPKQAVRIAKSIRETDEKCRSVKVEAMVTIVYALANDNPRQARRISEQAERIAKGITCEYYDKANQANCDVAKARALAKIAQAVAGIDLQRAERLFADATTSALSITYYDTSFDKPPTVNETRTKTTTKAVLDEIAKAAADSGLPRPSA